MSLRRNVIANYLGQVWVAIMGLAFIPLYIEHLGMEAFGLIGLFAIMQAWLVLLDMGMTPTLNREMARFSAGAHTPQSIRDLLRSLEIICFFLAVAISLGVWVGADYIASNWLKADRLPIETVARALTVMALVVALRLCEGIYRGSLFGLQRQVWFNAANSILAALRHGGVVVVLVWFSPTIEAFFLWQAFVSLLTLIVFAVKLHHTLPKAASPAKFRYSALKDIWQFAVSMVGITFLALLLTQVDKILLSRLLTLETFGYYALAATAAGAIYMIVAPIIQAIYPQMVEQATRNDQASLINNYHQGAQLVTVLTAPVFMLLSIHAAGVIYMWSGHPELARNTAPILSVLVLGNFLNGLMNMPYYLQLAHSWTSLAFKINIVAVSLLVPAILWVVPKYGAISAAWLWVILNAGYVLIAVHLLHNRLLPGEKWRWYISDVLVPLLGVLVVVFIAGIAAPSELQNRIHWFGYLLVTWFAALAAAMLLANRLRSWALNSMRKLAFTRSPRKKLIDNN